MDMKDRNWLEGETFKALHILKDAYKQGVLKAKEQAAACAPQPWTHI